MKTALLGTGLMGLPMVQRLIQAGHTLFVYNRTITKAEPLKEQGVFVSSDPKEAIKQAQCIILMLADAKAIHEVLFPGCCDVLNDKVVIQMGTIAPNESIELQKFIQDNGGDYFECPVLGSRKEASDGNLILMVGSSQGQFRKWQDFLKVFGSHPRRIGEVGQAAALKLALNQLIAAHASTFSLSLGIVEKNRVDTGIFMDILRASSLHAPMFDKKLANWLKRDFERPNFPAKHLLKDVNLIFKEAQRQDLSTEALEGVRRILMQTVEKGWGDKDYSSLFNIVNKI